MRRLYIGPHQSGTEEEIRGCWEFKERSAIFNAQNVGSLMEISEYIATGWKHELILKVYVYKPELANACNLSALAMIKLRQEDQKFE